MSSDEESINNDKNILDMDIDEQDLNEIGDDVAQNDENPNIEEVQRDETTEGNKNEENRVVKPKRIIRNPQPKLNAETLKGPRGIAALPSYFERVKFKGKGYEHQDLKTIMKTYEYWCHRLFPKFPFDTCIERLEKLGNKKAVQTHIKRIRFDLLIDEDEPIIDSSDEEIDVQGFIDIQNDEIEQQNQFDNLLSSSNQEVRQTQPELTEDQLRRIKLSKERAERLKKEKLKRKSEKTKINLEAPIQGPSTSSLDQNTMQEQFDLQTSQNDIFSETAESNIFEEDTFDLESNIKGKSNLKGSSAKKKSSKNGVRNNTNTVDCIEGFLENNEKDSNTILPRATSTDMDIQNDVEHLVLRRTHPVGNVIDSDQDMEDLSEIVSESSIDINIQVKKDRQNLTNSLTSDEIGIETDTIEKSSCINNTIHTQSKSGLLQSEKSTVLAEELKNHCHREEPLGIVNSQTETATVFVENLITMNQSDSSYTENKENSSIDNMS